MKKDKIIKMVEIELDISEEVVEKVVEFALEKIKNDRNALINYGVNELLREVVETDGKCLKGLKGLKGLKKIKK